MPELNDYRVRKLKEKRWAVERWDGFEWVHVQLFARAGDARAWSLNASMSPPSRKVRTPGPREGEL